MYSADCTCKDCTLIRTLRANDLTADQCQQLNHYRTAANWYVWGRQDAGDHGVVAFDFADAYAAMVGACMRGERSYRPAIQEAYAAFQRGEAF